MNTWFPALVPVTSINTTIYTLDRTYYEPLPSSAMNESNARDVWDRGMLEPWDGQNFKAWLAGDEAFKSALPNWEDCAFWNTGMSSP